MRVVVALLFSVGSRWYHCLHAFGLDGCDQLRIIVAFVTHQHLGVITFDQCFCLRAIVTLAGGQNQSQRIAQGINGDMNPGRKAATTSS